MIDSRRRAHLTTVMNKTWLCYLNKQFHAFSRIFDVVSKYNRLIIGVFCSAAQFVKVWRKWSITTTTDKPTLRHHHLLRESRQVEKSPLLFAADAVSCFSLSPQLPLHDDEQSQHKSIIIPLLVWALFFDGVSPASCKRRTCPWLTKCFLTLLSY